jgi:glycosyltransferase involved in cell wall biosynthesis
LTGGAGHQAEDGGNVVDLSVVMPCLNEEESVRLCIERAWGGIEQTGLRGEVVVCDNGSTDRSVEIAERAGARVVHEPRRGYGRAYRTGIEASVGELIVIGDSDCSYDFLELHKLVGLLLDGYDYVLGSRFAGTILPGAMPPINRYFGNPILTATLNRLFGLHTTDAHSGMRAFRRSGYERMQLRCDGMEFASEIVIAAARKGLRVAEVPIIYHPRIGETKLHRWRDGYRHLRFMFGEALRPRIRPESDRVPTADSTASRGAPPNGKVASNGRREATTAQADARGAAMASSDQTDGQADPGPADLDPGSSVKLSK